MTIERHDSSAVLLMASQTCVSCCCYSVDLFGHVVYRQKNVLFLLQLFSCYCCCYSCSLVQKDGYRTDRESTTNRLETIVLYTVRARLQMEQVYTRVDRVPGRVLPVVLPSVDALDHMQACNKSREQTPVYVKPSAGDARLASCVCAERTALYAGCRRRRMGFVVVALARGSQRRQ